MINVENRQSAENPDQKIEFNPSVEEGPILTEKIETEDKQQEGLPEEESIDNGLGILVNQKTLYHGSGVGGIKSFEKAENDTVGEGVYFTSEANNAIGYARYRAKNREGSPVVYEASVEGIKLADLRRDENVEKTLSGFRTVLEKKLEQPDLKWNIQEIMRKAVEDIDAKIVHSGNLRKLTFGLGDLFSGYISSIGYDGLITIEGGEGEEMGNHDTVLIFDPGKAKIVGEYKII